MACPANWRIFWLMEELSPALQLVAKTIAAIICLALVGELMLAIFLMPH